MNHTAYLNFNKDNSVKTHELLSLSLYKKTIPEKQVVYWTKILNLPITTKASNDLTYLLVPYSTQYILQYNVLQYMLQRCAWLLLDKL